MESKQQQIDALAEIQSAKAQAAEAQKIAEDLASGSDEALERVKLSAKAAYDLATADLKIASAKADGFNESIADKNSQINFMTAKEIDTTTEQGKKQTAKLEKLAKQLDKLSIKANAANNFVEKVTKAQGNAASALATALESIANKGKTV